MFNFFGLFDYRRDRGDTYDLRLGAFEKAERALREKVRKLEIENDLLNRSMDKEYDV